MNSHDYSISLQDPRWRAKSKKIKDRDGYRCVKCDIKNVELHVHHKYYYYGREPWDYTDNALITLCGACHDKEHAGKDISEFFRNSRRKKKPNPPKKKKEKKPKLIVEEVPIVKERRSSKELKQRLNQHNSYKENVSEDELDVLVLNEFNKRHPEHEKNITKKRNKIPLHKFKVREMKKIREELKSKL